MSDIENRLILLEKKYRKLQIILYLIIIFIVPLLLLGSKSDQPKIINAEKFIRLTPDGKPSLIIGDGFDNNLTFLDTNGKKQLEIGSTGGAFPHLTIYDKRGNIRLTMGLAAPNKDKDFPFFNIRNNKGEPTISFSTMFGYPLMQFFDEPGKAVIEIAASKTHPVISLNNKNEKPLVLITESFFKGGQIQLFDEKGKVIHSFH